MGINKVQYGNTTLIDLTSDTVTADKLLQGYTAHDRSGAQITGTATQGGSVTQDQDGFIVLPPTGGGGSSNWSWMGKNPTKVETLANVKEYLEDTDYATWTPTTTENTIVDATSFERKYYDTDYDYIIMLKYHSHFEYTASATGIAQPEDWYYSGSAYFYDYSTNIAGLTANTPQGASSVSQTSKSGLFYKSSQGIDSYSVANYSVYVSGWSPIYSCSLSQNQYSIVFNGPKISARCSNTYFSTDNALAVDQTTSYYEYKIEVWRVDRGTTLGGAQVVNMRDMWLNGF